LFSRRDEGSWLVAPALVSSPSWIDIFPNPAGGRATLGYRLDHRSSVRVDLVDPLGHMRPLHRSIEDAGEHSLLVDLSALPSGVYYCRVQAGGEVSTAE